MNRKNNKTPPFDDPARQREWQAQEAAMRHEQLHLDPDHDDPRTLSYRLLTRALKAEPPGGLPSDFAQQVSTLAAESEQSPATPPLETILMGTLACALVLSGVAATVVYGATWWPAFIALVPTPSIAQWLIALIGCLGVTWLVGAGSRLVTDPPNLE